jgi:hypothetical protein
LLLPGLGSPLRLITLLDEALAEFKNHRHLYRFGTTYVAPYPHNEFEHLFI